MTTASVCMATYNGSAFLGEQLDSILVDKSPFCRMDSDCWDVKLKFFDPDNNQRAKRIGSIKRQGVRAGQVGAHRRDHSSDLRQRQWLR